jgi:hypothetical protein
MWERLLGAIPHGVPSAGRHQEYKLERRARSSPVKERYDISEGRSQKTRWFLVIGLILFFVIVAYIIPWLQK